MFCFSIAYFFDNGKRWRQLLSILYRKQPRRRETAGLKSMLSGFVIAKGCQSDGHAENQAGVGGTDMVILIHIGGKGLGNTQAFQPNGGAQSKPRIGRSDAAVPV